MCLSCGCVLNGGSPTDDHDDEANITIGNLTAAANAPACGCSIEQAARNVLASVLKIQADQETVVIEDIAADPVIKALEAADAPRRFVLGVAYPASKIVDGKVDRTDLHREFMTVDEVELAAWDYARNHRRIGFFHVDGTEGHADLVESYIYRNPNPWEITDIDGQMQVIKTGDWVMGAILDEPGFELVKKRKADGWSVDGVARRRRKLVPIQRSAGDV